MKKLAVALCLVACLGMVIPAYALPSCPHTNSQGVTSVNFGNCILNIGIAIVKFGVNLRSYVCGASSQIIAICELVKPLAASVGAEYIVNVCESIITTGCSDTLSLQDLVTFINTYNAGQMASNVSMKGAPRVSIIDPTPIIDWGNKK